MKLFSIIYVYLCLCIFGFVVGSAIYLQLYTESEAFGGRTQSSVFFLDNDGVIKSVVPDADFAYGGDDALDSSLHINPTTDLVTVQDFEVLGTCTNCGSGSVTGGEANYIPIWSSASALSTSTIYQSSSLIGIGTTTPTFNLSVDGNLYAEEARFVSSTIQSLYSTSIYDFFDADCAASNYVYGINTDGSLDCRADANTTYSEDMTGFEYTGTSLGFSSGYSLPTTASTTSFYNTRLSYYDTLELIPSAATSSAWEAIKDSVYDAKISATTTIPFSFASSGAPFILSYWEDFEMLKAPSALTCTSVHCKIFKDGTSAVINFSDGTNDTNSITCGTAATSSMLTANNTWTLKESMQIEWGTLTANPDGLTGQLNCYRTQ